MNLNIDALIAKYVNKNIGEIIVGLNSEVTRLDAMTTRARKNFDSYSLDQYRQYAGDFLFFLNCGVIPAGIGIDGLRKFIPIINGLVKDGSLNASVLEKFK